MLLYVDYNFCSPYAMSSYVALREKDAPFELRRIDLSLMEHHEPAYAQMSLNRKVPLLVDGGFCLSESSAIAEYLEDTLGGAPLYPCDPQMRARARQIQAWLRSDFHSIRAERPTDVIFKGPMATPLSGTATAQSRMLFAAALQWLGDGDHVCGAWSIADVDMTVMLSRLVCNGDPVPDPLRRYVGRQWQRPSLSAWRQLPRN